MQVRTAHPYDDTDVIDSRAPRTNQAFIGSLALLAFLFSFAWLPALLALQLAGGLTFGRRYCAPCLFYFEVLQPRFGEGRLEDARPPRFANFVGLVFLSAATLAFVLGASTVGWVLTLVVAALALLAASTGVCAGCELYVRLARLRGLWVKPADAGLDGSGIGVIGFSGPYCLACRHWEDALAGAGIEFAKVDVAERPDLARRYRVKHTPLVLAVRLPEGAVVERYDDEPQAGQVERLAALTAA
ncbi:MAG: DUF4395 family protein [Thermoleophilaceae bacterium]